MVLKMKIYKYMLTAIALVILTGCGVESELQNSVKSTLVDPDSAKFGQYKIINNRACYEVNAKNGYGGYTGMQVAFMVKIKSKWVTYTVNDLDLSTCLEVSSKMD